MRHRKKINSLGRKAAHRKETMSSMATALILNKRINTTVAKAKALRTYVEPLITRSKTDNTHSRRMVFSYLKNKHAVSELFREVSQKVAERPGGYTRILKTGFRKGDAAEMCFIELVDYNTAMLATDEETQQKRTRRGRRRGKKKGPESEQPVAETTPQTAEAEETSQEAQVDETAGEQVTADAQEKPSTEDTATGGKEAEPKDEKAAEPEVTDEKPEEEAPAAKKEEEQPAAEESTQEETEKEEEKSGAKETEAKAEKPEAPEKEEEKKPAEEKKADDNDKKEDKEGK